MNAVLLQAVLMWASIAAAEPASDAAPLRTWSDTTGALQLEAAFVSQAGGKVTLKKADGTILVVPLSQLSQADQKWLRQESPQRKPRATKTAPSTRLSGGEPQELAQDDGKPAGRRSIAGSGHAVAFNLPAGVWQVTGIRLHGSRYGYPQPPQESFHVFVCDAAGKTLSDTALPYGQFERGPEKWVPLKIQPTKVPRRFLICVAFNPERTKGVYVSFDAQGSGRCLVGLPGRLMPFPTGDWMIRATVEPVK